MPAGGGGCQKSFNSLSFSRARVCVCVCVCVCVRSLMYSSLCAFRLEPQVFARVCMPSMIAKCAPCARAAITALCSHGQNCCRCDFGWVLPSSYSCCQYHSHSISQPHLPQRFQGRVAARDGARRAGLPGTSLGSLHSAATAHRASFKIVAPEQMLFFSVLLSTHSSMSCIDSARSPWMGPCGSPSWGHSEH